MDGATLDAYFSSFVRNAGVRRDATRFLAAVSNRYTLEAAKSFPSFDRPVLIVWGKDDILFSSRNARRLQRDFPDARLEFLPGSRAFVPEDQPEALASRIAEFVRARQQSVSDHLFFLLGFCLLLVHEMDAVRCKEWRVLPLTSWMEDEAGYHVFTALHVPLYALLLWGLFGGGANRGLVVGLDVFFVVHVLLHLIFYNHPENRFGSIFSYVLIFGAGLFGATDICY
jgi:hypothetical protein